MASGKLFWRRRRPAIGLDMAPLAVAVWAPRTALLGVGRALLCVLVAAAAWSAPDSPANPAIPLGPGDSILVKVRDMPEIEGSWRIGSDGYLQLPIVGRVAVSGISADEFREVLRQKLSVYLINPDVSVTIEDIRSRPLTVSGGVTNPGLYQLDRPFTLFDVVPLAGGVQDPGPTVTLKRSCSQGAIPHKEASSCEGSEASVLTVRLEEVTRGYGDSIGFDLRPGDSVIVSQSIATDRLYVTGEVRRPGMIELVNRDAVSLSHAIAMAGGFMNTAKASNVIIRPVGGEEPVAPEAIQTVNLKDVLRGEAPDVQLRAGYLVYVPSRNAVSQALLGAMSAFGSVSNGLILLGRL